ncbi:hypothetical protein AHAS_Ahas06G0044500 [Arachis hypogaea]
MDRDAKKYTNDQTVENTANDAEKDYSDPTVGVKCSCMDTDAELYVGFLSIEMSSATQAGWIVSSRIWTRAWYLQKGLRHPNQ